MGAGGKLRVVSEEGVVKVAGSSSMDVPAEEPSIPAGVLADPELLAAWRETVPQLDRTGLVTPADGPTIEMMLRHLVTARKAHRSVMEDGVEVQGENGTMKKNPSEAVFRLESAAFLELAKQLGMTWMVRARTASQQGRGEGGGANPFEGEATG